MCVSVPLLAVLHELPNYSFLTLNLPTYLLSSSVKHSSLFLLTSVLTRAGHAYAEYANDADYAHMRIMRMRMRIENLIHIIHI